MSWFGIPCIKSIYANSCLLVVWSKQKKNMWLGFFLLFGWESLLNKKNRAKKTFGQPLHKKSDSLSGRFIITNELFEPLDLKNWEEIWSSQNPCERRKEGNGFSNPEPLELQNSNIFFQKALPRACKVRRGADTWYTIARPTATTSQQEPV